MTFVGKILVIVIMVFALFFLALSTVVFTTDVNWKTEVTKLNDAKKKVTDEKNRLENIVKDTEAKLALAQDEAQKAEGAFKAKINDLTSQTAEFQRQNEGQRKSIEVALEQVKTAQDEAEARISEANVLRQNLQTVQKQRDEFLLQKTDLNQRIIILERELEVAQNNNKSLRDRTAILAGALNKVGMSSDPSSYEGLLSPPDDVEGIVTRVDPSNSIVEISIGKDDGLVVGHELVLYRTKPSPEYLGKVKIVSVEPNRATARVIGKTYLNKKIQEDDNVATKVRPRS